MVKPKKTGMIKATLKYIGRGKPNVDFVRCWINQPAAAELYGDLHGKLVLAHQLAPARRDTNLSENGEETLVYFTAGSTISMYMPTKLLSIGWPERLIDPKDIRLAELEQEVKDHAIWARKQMLNPESKMMREIISQNLELREWRDRMTEQLEQIKATKLTDGGG